LPWFCGAIALALPGLMADKIVLNSEFFKLYTGQNNQLFSAFNQGTVLL